MIAIQTFWTNQKSLNGLAEIKGGWLDARFHLMSWALSASLLKKHFKKVVLCADSLGKELLADVLKLPYDSVLLTQNELAKKYPNDVWVLRKIHSYQVLSEPFIHVDGDAFLWKKPTDSFLNNKLFAQNFQNDFECYKIAAQQLKNSGIGVPDLLSGLESFRAVNMGIVGGNAWRLFHDYYKMVDGFVLKNIDQIKVNSGQISRGFLNTLLEEALFAHWASVSCDESVQVLIDEKIDSKYRKIANLIDNPYNYHHLIGENKTELFYCKQVEQYLKKFFPEVYRRVIDYLSEMNIADAFSMDFYAESNYRLSQNGFTEQVSSANVDEILERPNLDENTLNSIVFEGSRQKEFYKIEGDKESFLGVDEENFRLFFDYLSTTPIKIRLNDKIRYNSRHEIFERVWDNGEQVFSSLVYDFAFNQAHFDDKIWDSLSVFIICHCAEDFVSMGELLELLKTKINQPDDEILRRIDLKTKELLLAGLIEYDVAVANLQEINCQNYEVELG